jgi:glycogen debranching enzyme
MAAHPVFWMDGDSPALYVYPKVATANWLTKKDHNMPSSTALQNTCIVETPSDAVNRAFVCAKDNIARCMRYYTHGWGMSNAPHSYTIVVGRDTGWMGVGADYIAPWFAPAALAVFRDRQKPNGQIIEYVDLETDRRDDYGLNVADNTPLYMWGVWHHWQQHDDPAFRRDFLPSMRAAAEHLLREIGPRGLIVAVPAGVMVHGIASWRNIIPETVIAGEVTELNTLSAMALRCAADFCDEPRYAQAATVLAEAINKHLWREGNYLLTCYDGQENTQVTGDTVFPAVWGVASPEGAQAVLARLAQPDFWTPRGLRTVPATDPGYDPRAGFGLIGGSWPNLTLWYAAAVASLDADRALAALETVARPVIAPDGGANMNAGEFAEWFDGETDQNRGMLLSPWVAPTFIWAVLEGLLGLTWHTGQPTFAPHWPSGWDEVRIRRLPGGGGFHDMVLRK